MVLLDYASYILFNVCVLYTVGLCLSLFVCVRVFCVFSFYGLKPEINAFIHSFIHCVTFAIVKTVSEKASVPNDHQ